MNVETPEINENWDLSASETALDTAVVGFDSAKRKKLYQYIV